MISAAQLVALRDQRFTREEAAKKLLLDLDRFRRLLVEYAIEWPQWCRHRHDQDWVMVGNKRRCRTCLAAEREREKARRRRPSRPPPRRSPRNTDAELVRAALSIEAAVAAENLPPWERHPQPIDPRDVVYRPHSP